MFWKYSDKEWEDWGKSAPYYGVLSNEKWRPEAMNDEAWQDFFYSGRHEVRIFREKRMPLVDPKFAPETVLDFGCGVGRLTLPWAEHVKHAYGVDISPSMLAEAEKNAQRLGLENATFALADDTLSAVPGPVDHINSFIVFQHIGVRRGMKIFNALLDKLNPGGTGSIHFTYAKYGPIRWLYWPATILKRLPFGLMLHNKLRNRPLKQPGMDMNDYNLNAIYKELWRRGVHSIHSTLTDHGGCIGATLFFKLPR